MKMSSRGGIDFVYNFMIYCVCKYIHARILMGNESKKASQSYTKKDTRHKIFVWKCFEGYIKLNVVFDMTYLPTVTIFVVCNFSRYCTEVNFSWT